MDDNGCITWAQLEQIIMIACHGDPCFTSELTAYFKVKMNIEMNEDGKPMRMPRKMTQHERRQSVLESNIQRENNGGRKKLDETEEDAEPSEAVITLPELNEVTDGMMDWMNSTGWEWPSIDRPLTAGLTSSRGMMRAGVTRGGMKTHL